MGGGDDEKQPEEQPKGPKRGEREKVVHDQLMETYETVRAAKIAVDLDKLFDPRQDNKPVRRVSSQHTTSALFNASVARCVMSPKLPMGVATNINVPALTACASLRLRQVAGPNVQTIQLLPQSLFAQKTREAARDFCSRAAP